jgi:serine/threonine protein kinase
VTSSGYRPFDGDAWLGRDLPLAGGPYRIEPEDAFAVAEEMAFARQGRKARVFKLRGPDGKPYALKTFYRGFSLPEYLAITRSLLALGDIPGLHAGRRRIVDEDEARAIGEPGLTYSVLMPWIEGVAWAGVIEGRFPLAAETCLAVAVQAAGTLARMEAGGLVHADISSSNVLITNSEHGPAVELIDVEDMYHDSFGPLPYVPDGSPGYAHPRNQGRGCRNRHGDRFAGAILLAEMLSWPDPAVRQSTADVSVFEPAELCRGGPKFDLVRKVLQTHSTELATLFERVWDSPSPASCPRLAEWDAAMATLSPVDGDRPLATSPNGTRTAFCPGCGRPVRPGRLTADHATDCPLRTPAAPAPVPGKSSFPGVPSNDNIGFIPLFGDHHP